MKIPQVSIIGAGAWGTAIAHHLASGGARVTIWSYEAEVSDDINLHGRNGAFLPNIELDQKIRATSDLAEACKNRLVFFAVPSHVMETIIRRMAKLVPDDAVIVSVTKGIEGEKLRLPSQIFAEYLKPEAAKRFVSLSGPSFAREVALGLPTAVTAASHDAESAALVQETMSNETFRVYTHDDITGVELGGAVKNVVAIAAGISDGLKYGHNARAAIITRGLAEMVRLGLKMGAREKTFAGLAGVGDLLLTASGELSRNRTAGFKLGRGGKISEIMAEVKTVAEGVRTSSSIYRLSEKMSVDMPLCSEVYYVCHENKEPKTAVMDLMTRSLKEEFYG